MDHGLRWLDDLRNGLLPEADAHFGESDVTPALQSIVGELGLPALTRGVPVLAEQVLRTLLWHLDLIPDLQPRLTRAEAVAQAVDGFREAWRVETAGLDDEMVLLRDLADGAELHWDTLRGQLRSREWQAARQAADRLAQLPSVTKLLERLGRSTPRPSVPQRAAPEAQDVPTRIPLRAQETRIPGAPGELTGIRLSADLARMLPGEAALLRHPVGRRLWRARHAEGRLLAHDSQAVLTDWRPDPSAAARHGAAQAPPQPLAHGPFILCLDTSGSMRGAPEHIAKAVALAAVRAARASERGCHLIAFGGPGELIERDLAGPGGLDALLELMGQGFDGGTDVQTPIERAIERVHDSAWRSADLLIVSDGEFGCVPATLQRLDAARLALGLAVHGILVGDRETMGLLEVCDEIHWIRDWRRHTDTDDPASRTETRLATPVHSKSLTALYFPNALSARASRLRTP
jgi:uncharacterized protein with von Willebrand factor type A (vWA) domain